MDKRSFSNLQPISSLKVNQKLLPKALTAKLKKYVDLIGPTQLTLNDRFIGESGNFISDIVEACDLEKLSASLMTLDLKKHLIQ